MLRRYIMLLLLTALLVMPTSGWAMDFTSAGYVFNAVNEAKMSVDGQKIFKSFAPLPVTDQNGTALQFVPMFERGCLKLTSGDGQRDYLSFTVAEGERVLVQEIVGREPFAAEAALKCWAIITTNSTSGNVNNFWLVGGPVKDTYAAYVSSASLAAYGFSYPDMRLDIKYAALLVRGGTRWLQPLNPDGQPVRADAAVIELFWDKDAAWFGLKRIV